MKLLEQAGIDALLVTGATNRRYLSRWSADDHAPDRPSGIMLVTSTERILYASPTNLPWAASEVDESIDTRPLTAPWTSVLADEIRARSLTRLGFEDAVTTVASYRELSERLGDDVTLVPVGNAVDRLREVKSSRELALIEQALAITDTAFGRAAAHVREGMPEKELAAFIDQQFRDLGSDGQAFDTIVASGPNAAKPHHSPGDRRIEAGEPIIIDMGARVGGYCGDLTRTLWVGQPSDRLGTMYHLVAEAQRAALATIRSGAGARDVDRAARELFAAANLEQYFVHGVGHAIGLRIHESPFMGQASNDVLVAGNVVTIEPGVYIPGWGGVRIEDVAVVEDDGCRNLTRAPKLLGEGDQRTNL